MRRLLILAAGLLAASASAAPAPVSGRWITDEGKALVEIGPCGQKLCGRILRVLKPTPGRPQTDANNPDPALRSLPIQGLVFLTGFTPDDDRWRGRIYDPESGKTYRSELIGTGNTLAVKGCIAFFCRTQTWARAH